ncbi:hypothetical protein [Tsukamurella spumae]|uniref:Uncharacterized protein n=1 Tax=Tsukamurella spumae TaxID=44753 RepID=A0A846WZP8_9ACTN|nr:hypothetical protein [Tsukamurella spumae]NKY18688.1 hypothetical protein [Tsukamurella spumae]
MAPLLILAVPAFLVVTTIVIIRLIVTLSRTQGVLPPTDESRRASRWSASALAISFGVAILATTWVFATDRLGRGVLLAGPVFLTVLQLGVLATTVIIGTAVRSNSGTRVASLGTRRAYDSAPRLLATMTGAGAVLAVTIGVIACRTASVDSGSGEFRAFEYTTAEGSRSTYSPFAGAFYSGPLVLTLMTSVVIAALTLVGAQRWGALDQPGADRALRMSISTRAVAATAMITSLLLVILGLSLSQAAFRVASAPDDSGWWAIGRVCFPAAVLAGALLGTWALVAFLLPTLGRRGAA